MATRWHGRSARKCQGEVSPGEGLGLLGGPHPTGGTRQRPAGPRAAVGDPEADRSRASPPPAAHRSSTAPLRQVLNWGWGVPRGAPSPTLGLQRGPSRPLAPCPCPTPITVQDPKVVARPPQLFLGVTVLREVLGRDTASGFTPCVPPPNPSCRALIHCRRVWATFTCPFPANGGTTPKKSHYLQAWRGWGLRCSARVLGSDAGGCRAWGGFFPHPTLPPLCQAAAEEGLLHQGSVHPIFFFGGGGHRPCSWGRGALAAFGVPPPHGYGTGSQPSGVEAASPCPLGSW